MKRTMSGKHHIIKIEPLSNFEGTLENLFNIVKVLKAKYGPTTEIAIWKNGTVTLYVEKK